jgi:HAD superfamily hydrolase (TIGR01457 family)
MLKAVLLDLDGTIYKGKSAIPGTAEALEKLREKGIRLFFISNAATQSRIGVVERLAAMGIRSAKEEIYNSSYATAMYLCENFPGRTVFCFGEEGMKEEFRAHGIKTVEDESADIVVVSLDRTINYQKMTVCYRAIRNGALFIATNDDADFPVEDGYLPGAGAMVAAVERCTGKKPFIVGKPNTYFARLILEENKLKKDEVITVGDRLETDVRFARNAGIKSILVLTGVTKKEDIEKSKDKPDYVTETINKLPELLEKIQ